MSKLKILPKRFEILDAKSDDCRFRINIDVINECFGANRSLYMKASYPDNNTYNFSIMNSNIKMFAWMPKLYSNSSDWKNRISEDKEYIYEIAENDRQTDWIPEGKHPLDDYRLVFTKSSPKEPYVFQGVYKSEKMDFLKHTYKRIATKVRLIGDPVCVVEIIE